MSKSRPPPPATRTDAPERIQFAITDKFVVSAEGKFAILVLAGVVIVLSCIWLL